MFQGTCDDTASWPPRRPADGQQRAALRRECDGTRSRGPDQTQSSHVLNGTSGGLVLWCLRVTSEPTSAHPCLSVCLRAKRPPEDTRWRSSRGTAPHKKSSLAAQRTGGHRRVTTRKTTGDLATRRGAGDPERRAEWMTVLRCGHLRSAPVVVEVCCTHGVGTAYIPCILVGLHAPCLGASSMASCLSSNAQTRLRCPTERVVACFLMTDREEDLKTLRCVHPTK